MFTNRSVKWFNMECFNEGGNDRKFGHHCNETNRATAVVVISDFRCLCIKKAVPKQLSTFRNA